MKKTDSPIVVRASFKRGVAVLWNALTELPVMKKWYFEMLPDFKADEGFKTSFSVYSEGRTFTHQWRVTEVVPNSKITYRWQFKEYPGTSTSSFEVSGDDVMSELRLTIRVEEDFPSDIPEFTRESCIGGWEYFIHGNLKKFLTTP